MRGCCAAVAGVPALGVKAFEYVCGEESTEQLSVTESGFETPYFKGEFDGKGRIKSLIDLRNGRQVAKAPLNDIICYENKPHN